MNPAPAKFNLIERVCHSVRCSMSTPSLAHNAQVQTPNMTVGTNFPIMVAKYNICSMHDAAHAESELLRRAHFECGARRSHSDSACAASWMLQILHLATIIGKLVPTVILGVWTLVLFIFFITYCVLSLLTLSTNTA